MTNYLYVLADAAVSPEPALSLGMLVFVGIPLLIGLVDGGVALAVILTKKKKRSENRQDGYSGASDTEPSQDQNTDYRS